MAGENLALRDIGISHAIGVRRLSTGVVNNIVGLLNSVDADLVKRIENLDPTSVSARWTRIRLDRLLADLRDINQGIYKQIGSGLKSDLIDLAKYEAGYQASSIGGVLGAQFNVPTPKLLTAAVTAEPFVGRLLSEWVDGLEEGRFNRLRDAVRISVVGGEGINELVKRIRGSRELNYRDGVLQISRRSAEAMARTAVMHTVSAARQVTYEENKDILDGVRWMSTLDTATCEECAGLDGEVYDVDAGPRPPHHISCRCTTVPVVKGGGQAGAVTYASWLKDQPPEVQDEALGPTRADLYREGGLTIDRFTDDLNRGLTLDQLRQIEPQAFEDAGLAPKVPLTGTLFAGAPEEMTTFGKWESGLGAPLTDKQQARINELALNTPGLSKVLPYMSSDEAARLNKANAARIVSAFETYPKPEEMAAVAYSGRAKRGWYENSANAIVEVFGAQDAPRFAAMMAGMSPQTSVESNAINSLTMWTNWIKAGRPTDRDDIVKLMGKSVQGGKGEGSVLPAWINNTVRALTAPDPEAIVLSGPKVNSFALNLRNQVNAVTLDTWMANFANMSPDLFRKAGGALPAKGPVYTGVSAAVRRAAEVATEMTGDQWTPAEIQETVWSWARALSEKAGAAGEDRTAVELLKAGDLTWKDIKDTPDFEVLFTQDVFRKILEEGGYGEGIAAAARSAAARGGAEVGGTILSAEGSGFTQDAFVQHLEQAAARLDALREGREEAALKFGVATPETDKLTGADIMYDVTGLAHEGAAGILTPRGEVFDFNQSLTHAKAAAKVGTSMDKIYEEGAARIYVIPGDMLGIEIHKPPSAQQISELMKLARNGQFNSFAIEDGAAYQGPVTPATVRTVIGNQWPELKTMQAGETDKGVIFLPPKPGEKTYAMFSPEQMAVLEKHATVMATDLEYPAKRVEVSNKVRTFELDGVERLAGAETDPSGKITMYPRVTGPSGVKQTLAHEVEHQKVYNYFADYEQERAALYDRINMEAPFKLTEAGLLPDKYANEFPLYQEYSKVVDANTNELIAKDGITNYSEAWWSEFKNGKADLDIAMHETLAEIARVEAAGSDLAEIPQVWRDVYNSVNKNWKEYHVD